MHSMDEMQRAGCTTPRGVRWWEEQGLLGAVTRSRGNTRQYTSEQLDRARIIAAAQFGGFDLETVKRMLDEYGAEVREALLTRLADQARACVRLGENLPPPQPPGASKEYDL
jgi:DNA-binding transcriptional MerR regulator